MYNPKQDKKSLAKRHFKRTIRRESDALMPRKRLQYSYRKTLNHAVKLMFPDYVTLHY